MVAQDLLRVMTKPIDCDPLWHRVLALEGRVSALERIALDLSRPPRTPSYGEVRPLIDGPCALVPGTPIEDDCIIEDRRRPGDGDPQGSD